MDNIFDAAGKFAQSKKNKALNEKPRNELIKNRDSSEIDEMLQKMRDMKVDLEQQLSRVYQKGKDSKIDGAILVDNISHLTRQQLKEIEEQEKILTEKIQAAIPAESCLKKNPKSKEKLTQERQGKMRGMRNNWIPVR